MESFKARLKTYARQVLDKGETAFEDYCGIHHGTISAIKANGPTASVITKIAVACPSLNLNWLFRGEGNMIIQSESPEIPSTPAQSVVIGQHVTTQNVAITNLSDLKDILVQAIREAKV